MVGTGFWWILLAAGVYGLVHSLLASNRTKRLAEQSFGPFAYRRFYRLFFSVMGAVMLIPIVLLAAILPDRLIYTIPAPWVYLTLALQAAALLGLTAAVMQTGVMPFLGIQQVFTARTGQVDSRPEKLIVNGFYRWVRHPLYTFSFILLWLTPTMTWNILAMNLAFSAYMLIGSVFEENKLVEQFGKDYEGYRSRTPRIIPGFKRWGK